MTSVRPEGRFGALELDKDKVTRFIEKPGGDGGWINGGFFVCQPEVFDYIPADDSISFERQPLEKLALDGQMVAYRHHGFWRPMDTLRDKNILENLVQEGKAQWLFWQH